MSDRDEDRISIRPERPKDYSAIRRVNTEAFGTPAEGDLVENLRESGIPLISLVAESEGTVVGHILFTPVRLENDQGPLSIAGLGPMAVSKAQQRKGIGSALVKAGLKACRRAGYVAVVVVGHPEYYGRFGFTPAVRHGLTSDYPVPDNVFMIRELKEGSLANRRGRVKYHPAFHDL